MKRIFILLFALICSAATAWGMFPFPTPMLETPPSGPVVLQYVSNGGITCSSTGSSLTPGMPASVKTGDLLVLEVEVGISSGTVPTPSGWTSIMNQYYATKTNSWAVFYRLYSGGGAPSVTGGTYIAAVISRYTGANATTPIGAVGTFSQGATTTITTTALTTTANNSLVALAMLAPNVTGAAYTTPSGWSGAFDKWVGTCNSEQAIVTKSVATSGSSSGSTSSLDSNFYVNGFNWFAIQFEILHY